MSKPSYASISSYHARCSLAILALCFVGPAILVFGLPFYLGGFPIWFQWVSVVSAFLIALPIVLLHQLIFRVSTVGSALFCGTLLVVSSVISTGSLTFWEQQLSTKELLKLTHPELRSFVTILTGMLQSSLSLFCAAVGGGIVAACIFQSRVHPTAPDTKTGKPNKS